LSGEPENILRPYAVSHALSEVRRGVSMSIKRLNPTEKATYLIGLAVRRQLDNAPADPDTVKEIDAVFRWLEHWLTPDEVFYITENTGHIIGGDLADELFGPEEPTRPARTRKPGEPGDVPF
jgi:hypothetical protein